MSSSQNVSEARAEEAFAQLYLQKVTAEFSNDLDKLRTAPDFKGSSIDTLVNALQQGQSTFAREDRVRMGRQVLERDAEQEN